MGENLSGGEALLPLAVLAAAAAFVFVGVREWRRYWLIADTPTVRCTAATIGRNEVVGRARAHHVLRAPITGQPCVWFRWRVHGQRDSVMGEGSSTAPFWVVDDTGGLVVRPRGADVDGPTSYEASCPRSGLPMTMQELQAFTHAAGDGQDASPAPARRPWPWDTSTTPISRLDGVYRISEWCIGVEQPVYVLGTAGLRDDVVGLELAKRSGGEYLLISAEAEPAIARAHRRRALGGLLVGLLTAMVAPLAAAAMTIARARTGALSSGQQDPARFFDVFFAVPAIGAAMTVATTLRKRMTSMREIYGLFQASVVMPVGFIWYVTFVFDHSELDEKAIPRESVWDLAAPWMLTIGAVYLALLGVLFWSRVYNRLVAVKQQAAMAWSSIDVALRRRHDLLPGLVEVARKYAQHEREIQPLVAQLRLGHQLAPATALPTGDALRGASDLDRSEARGAHALLALGEAYPALRADAVFQDLGRRIVDTENRIAYARHFYNDAVTVLRDRRRTFPGLLVAPFVATPSWELFAADPGPAQPVPVAVAPPPPPAPAASPAC